MKQPQTILEALCDALDAGCDRSALVGGLNDMFDADPDDVMTEEQRSAILIERVFFHHEYALNLDRYNAGVALIFQTNTSLAEKLSCCSLLHVLGYDPDIAMKAARAGFRGSWATIHCWENRQ